MKRLLPVLAAGVASCSLPVPTNGPTSRPSETSARLEHPEQFDKPERARNGGYLGIFFEEIRIDGRTALHIRTVQETSDAHRLGFRAGDKIVRVDGKAFGNGDEFIKMLWHQSQQAPEPPVERTITVLRGGKETVLQAGLAELDATPAVGDAAPDFTLGSPGGADGAGGADGQSSWNLKQRLQAGKPVVLVFGSYT